jgi:hypothetical protein
MVLFGWEMRLMALVQGLDDNGEKGVPLQQGRHWALAAIALAGLKTAATKAKSRSLARQNAAGSG